METEVLVNEESTDRVQVTSVRNSRSRFYKLSKTGVFFLGWTCLGLWFTVVTPCVDILRDQVHTDYEGISRALAAKSGAIIFGSVIGGYLVDKFQKQIDIIMSLEILVAGLAIAAVPWTPNLSLMATAFAINGLCHGGLSAAGNAHAILMWGAKASGPVHFIHFGFGVGTILGPIIMAPFLPNNAQGQNHTVSVSYNDGFSDIRKYNYHDDFFYLSLPTMEAHNNTPSHSNGTLIDVRVPFAITGGISVVSAFLVFLFVFFPYYKYIPQEETSQSSSESKNKTFKEIISPGECAAGNVSYGLQMFILIFLFYVALVGKDTGVTIFIEPIARNSPHLQFTLRETDIIVTVYSISYAVGRLLIAVIGIWIPIQVIIFVEGIANVAALILLIMYGLSSHVGFWLTNMMFAFFTGPMFPSGMAWIDRYIKMTGLAFSILDIGIGLGSFTFIWICGYLLKTHSHIYLYYLSLCCCSVELLVLIVMQIRGSIAGDRYKNKEREQQGDESQDVNTDQLDDTSPLVQ